MIARQADHRQAATTARGMRAQAAPSGPAGHDVAAGGHPLLRVQRMAGNRAAQRAAGQYLASPDGPRPASATAMRVGPADDRHERAADRVAQQVTRHGGATRGLASRRARGPDTGGVVLPEVQRAIMRESRAGGQPVPEPVRARFEQAIGAGFGPVRVHTDQRADDLARSLQARAFTTGRDIFFRRGQYEPGSRDGQQVLAHELTHVVQQATASPPGAGAMIQRSVGFEFETDWGIHGIEDPAKRGRAERPAKHTEYKEGDGFTVQVDEASRGFKPGYKKLRRQIEFVVKPHEETDEGAAKLVNTMRSLKAEAEGLNQLRADRKDDERGFKYPGANRDLWVFPDAKDTAGPKIHARAQATIGLALPAISAYALLPQDEPAKTRTGGYLVTHARREASLRGQRGPFTAGAKAATMIKGASPELSGLVSLLVLYIKIFHEPYRQKEDYVKGYLPMLAKTDFATMFAHLPAEEQKKYGKNKGDRKKFAKVVLDCVTLDPTYGAVRKEMPVIPGTQMPGDPPLKLTLLDWLSSIAGGEDKLTPKTDKRLFGLGDLGEDAEKGKKTDPAPGSGSPRMIIEFRGGSVGMGPKGSQGFLTPDEWIEFTFDYFNLVRQLHGAEPVPEWDEFKPPPPPEAKAKPKKPKAKTKTKTKVRAKSATTTPRRRSGSESS